MKKNRADKRRVLLINPEFQRSFLRYTSGLGVAVIGIFYLANSYFFWKFVKKGQDLGLPADHIFFRFLAEQRTVMDLISCVTAVVVLAITIGYGLYLSNRVAGPIYHLQKHLRSWLAGNTKELKFRKDDYFHELADTVNACLKTKSAQSKSDIKKEAS